MAIFTGLESRFAPTGRVIAGPECYQVVGDGNRFSVQICQNYGLTSATDCSFLSVQAHDHDYHLRPYPLPILSVLPDLPETPIEPRKITALPIPNSYPLPRQPALEVLPSE